MICDLAQNELKRRLRYDADSGIFTWLITPNNYVQAGRAAGAKCTDGYIQISINGRIYNAHRLAWLYITGEWPALQIDHINGVRDDNRFFNLRQATREQNGANQKRADDNLSGYKGVTFRKDRKAKPWQARIRKDRQCVHLGFFVDPQSAHSAYREAALRLFGDFARNE